MSTNQQHSQLQFLQDYKLEGNKLDILIYPHPILAKKATDIDVSLIDSELVTLAKNMLYTMYLAPGVGLAAPQIGKSIRMIVLDVNYTRDKIVTPTDDEDDEFIVEAQEGEEEEESADDEEKGVKRDKDEEKKDHDENIKKQVCIRPKYKLDNFHPMVLINPIITNKIGTLKCNEGCLSLPGIHEDVERALEVDVEFYNLKGEKEILHATDLLSICIQHECDHLQGIVLLDHLSLLKRNFHKRKLMKRKK